MRRKAARTPRRAAALFVATSAFLMSGALPALADTGTAQGQGPGGANGTIKIHQDANDTAHHNVPHVDCSFYVAFFGFDADQNGTLSFKLQAPTLRDGDDQSLGSNEITLANDARGTGATFDPVGSGATTDAAGQAGPFTLDFTGVDPQPQQGFHVKASFAITHVDGKSGKSTTTYKHKVFWVAPCGGVGPGTPTVAGLRVCKATTGSLAGTFPFTITGPGNYSNSFDITVPTGSNGPVCHDELTGLVAGDYTVTETADASKYTLTGITLDPSDAGTTDVNAGSATVTLAASETPATVTTSFTNAPVAVLGTGGTKTPPTVVLGEHFTRTPTTAPRVLGVQFAKPKTLPFTGSHTKPLLLAGVLALVCGTLLVLAGRRPATVSVGRHRAV